MITDPKDQKEFFGIDAENPEKFKEEFNKKYTLKANAAKDPEVRAEVSGAVLGSEMTNLYRIGKENGIEFDAEEKKSIQKNEDLVAGIVKKLTGNYVNKIADLEKTAGHGSDEKLNALKTENEKLATKLKETDAAWKSTAEMLESEKKNGATAIKQFKVTTAISKERESLKMKQKLTEVERIGFETAISNRLKFDLAENGEIEVFNSEGKRIPSKTKAGEFVKPAEALQDLVNELGLAEINPHGGRLVANTQTQIANNRVQTKDQNQEQGRTVLVRGKPTKI